MKTNFFIIAFLICVSFISSKTKFKKTLTRGNLTGQTTTSNSANPVYNFLCTASSGQTYIVLQNSNNVSSNIIPSSKPWGQSDSNVITRWSKIAFNPSTLLVNTGDFTYASSTGYCSHYHINQVPFGSCFDCAAPNSQSGYATIDLTGTNLAVDDNFAYSGAAPAGTISVSNGGQIVNLTGGGACGWASPVSTHGEGQSVQGGWYLKLKLINSGSCARIPQPTSC